MIKGFEANGDVKISIRRMIIALLMMLFLSTGLVLIPVRSSIRQNRSQIVSFYETSLHTSASIMDDYISSQKEQLYSLTYQSITSNQLALSSNLEPKDYFEIYQVMNRLKSLGLDSEVTVAYRASRIFISAAKGFNISSHYDSLYADLDLNEREFYALLFSKDRTDNWTSIVEKKNGEKVIILRQALRFEQGEPVIVGFRIIDVAALIEMSNLADNNVGSNMILLGPQGTLIYQYNPNLVFPPPDSLLMKVTSDIIPVTYAFSIPDKIINQSGFASLRVTLVIVSIGLFVLILLILWQFISNKRSFQKIINSNSKMNVRLENQIVYIKDSFYRNLLYGHYYSVDQMKIAANLAGLEESYQCYSVIVIEIRDDDEFSYMNSGSKQITMKYSPLLFSESLVDNESYIYMSYLQYNTFALISAHDDPVQLANNLQNMVSSLMADFKGSEFSSVYIGIGEIQDGLMSCSESYNQARCAINHIFTTKQVAVKYYNDIHPLLTDYKLTEQTKNMLLDAVTKGKTDLVNELIKKIVYDNIVDQNLSESTMEMLFYELCTMINSLKYLIDENDTEFISGIESFVLGFGHRDNVYHINDIRQMLLQITNYSAARKKEYGEQLIYDMRSYIDDNYTDTSLSLQMLSDQFSISESYFSQLFKKHLNVNFYQYLEQKRMQYACEILESSNRNVQEIAEVVGYQSVNTFGRAFKRYYKMSPGEYRKLSQMRDGIAIE